MHAYVQVMLWSLYDRYHRRRLIDGRGGGVFPHTTAAANNTLPPGLEHGRGGGFLGRRRGGQGGGSTPVGRVGGVG